MIRILHAADLHLDSPFEGLPSELAALRRGEQRALLGKLTGLARENDVQLVLLSGDLFDSDCTYAQTGQSLLQALEDFQVPAFIAPGNHDFYSRRSRYAQLPLPGNVHLFTEPELGCVELPDLHCRVWGAGFQDKSCPPLLRGFSPPKQAGVTDLLCLHGEVGSPNSDYNPISESELAASGMDYAALGHVHAFSGARRAGNCTYAWPGCPEGRGFDETGEKGVILADVGPGDAKIQFVPLGGRKYEILTVDADVPDLAEAIRARLPGQTHQDTYRIVLTGERNQAPDLAALHRELEGLFFRLQLRDHTRLRRNLWERAEEDSLRGVFLRKLREKYAAAQTEAEQELITQAARWGLAALDNGEEVRT